MSKSRILLCLLFSILIVPVVDAQTEAGGGETQVELRILVEGLVGSVRASDDAGVDAATCLNDMVHAQLKREQALGLISNPQEPSLVTERRSAVRAAVYAFVERLLQKGRQVESIDASGIDLFSEEENGEMLLGEGDEELEITAAGVLRVKMLTSERPVDIDVSRLRDLWCLNPLSMQ